MPTFDEVLQAKQAEVSSAKSELTDSVAVAKQSFAEEVAATKADRQFVDTLQPTVNQSNEFADAVRETGDARRGLESESPVIEQEGNISKHADGTYSVITAEGKKLAGLDEVNARSFSGFNAENARAVEAGAPTSFLGTKANAIAQTTVDLGTQAASAFTKDPKNLRAIKEFGAQLKTHVPVNRKEQVAAHTAFTTIAKNNGNFAAIKNALFNDLDTLVSQGIDSVPYMVAFTIGGPITQTSILTSLALGKGNQAVEEFTEVNGRRPSPEETHRIKIWSAVGAVAEKYGDMAALRAVPGRLAWMTQVAKTVRKTTPPSILSLTVLRPAQALAGEGLSGAITSASEQKAATGEITDTAAIAFDTLAEAAGTPGGVASVVAGSAAIKIAKRTVDAATGPSTAERIKTQQEEVLSNLQTKIDSTDPSTLGETEFPESKKARKIVQDMQEGKVPLDTKELEKQSKILNTPLTADQEKTFKTDLNKLKKTLKDEFAGKKEESKKGTPVDDNEFKETLSGLDFSNLKATRDSLNKLAERTFTLEQKTTIDRAINKFKDALSKTKQKKEKDDSLGSQQEVTELSAEQIAAIRKDPDSTEQDIFVADSAERVNRLEKELQANEKKTITDVHEHVISGISDRWTGLNTYRQQIQDISNRPIDPVIAAAQIEAIESNMRRHADNLAKKLEVFTEAAELAKLRGSPVIVRSEQDESAGPRVINYLIDEDATAPAQGQKREAFSFAIGKNSARLINTLTKEVAFGREVINLVEGYKTTSFKAKADQQAAEALEAETILNTIVDDTRETTFPLTQEGIDSSAAPAKTQSKQEQGAQNVTEPATTKSAAKQASKIGQKTETIKSTSKVSSPDRSAAKPETTESTEKSAGTKDSPTQNFVEKSTHKFPTIITESALNKWAAGKATAKKSAAQWKAGNKEFILGVLGKSFTDLVKMKKQEGIHTLPDEAFNPENLPKALVNLGTTPETAKLLAGQYQVFKQRYDKIALDTGNSFAIRETLAILHRDGELPPQVLFSMMLGTFKWVQQTPDNVVFKTKLDREMFMYGGQGELSPDEVEQLMGNDLLGAAHIDPLGHSYQNAVSSVGNDVASMMHMSANSTEHSVYFDNLKVAFGLAAIQIGHGGLFTIQDVHTWKFVNKVDKTRVFQDGDKYKHIKVSDDNKVSQAGNAAISDMMKAIKANVQVDSHLPLQQPHPTVVDSVQNSAGGVPAKVKAVLTELQKVAWTKADTLDVAAKLTKSHKDVLNTIMDVIPFDETDHEVQQVKLKAANSDKTKALADVMEALDAGALDKFYFRYALQVQHRIMMQGSINPQQSKVTRFLLRPYDPVEYTKDNLFLFQLSVASNLGFSIDKNRPEAAIEAFNSMVADKNVIDAVNAIINIEEPGQVAKLAGTLPLIKETFGGNMSILNALTALSKYMPVRNDPNFKFTSDAVLEIDGISNGAAINALQFPMFDDVERVLNQGGTYYGSTTAETTHNVDTTDLYEDLVILVKKFSSAKYAEAHAEDASVVHDPDSVAKLKTTKKFADIWNKRNDALIGLFPDLADGNLRDLVKYPFLIFLYGGQAQSISEGVAKDIISDIYEDMNTLQKTWNNLNIVDNPLTQTRATKQILMKAKQKFISEELQPFADNLETLSAFVDKSIKAAFINAVLNNKSKSFHLNDIKLRKDIASVVKPRFDFALNGMLGGTNNARNSVVQGGEILHALFLVHFEKAEKAKLAEFKGTRSSLTKKEINALIEDTPGLREVLPQSAGPLSDSKTFTDLSKQISTDKTSDLDTSEFAYKKNSGRKGVASSTGRETKFDFPGVSALIRQIINQDSAALTMTLKNDPNLLMLHDAVMGSPVQLLGASDFYGGVHLELNKRHSVIQSTLDQVHKVLALTDPADKAKANAWIKRNGFNNSKLKVEDRLSIDQMVNQMETDNTEVQEARDAVQTTASNRGGIVSRQLFMHKAPTEGPTTFHAEQLAKVQVSVDRALDTTGEVEQTDTDFLTTEQDEKLTKDSEEFGSLNNLPRENRTPITGLVGDLTPTTLNSLFKRFSGFSGNYYANTAEATAHTSVLNTVFQSLSKGVSSATKTHLSTEFIDGITHGSYTPLRDAIRVSVSRVLPASRNAQSPQEVFVHEMLHAVTSKTLKSTPLVARKVARLFKEVKADLGHSGGYRVFLGEIAGNPTTADIEAAKAQYKYIFNNPENEANKLDEFLAYAVTNKAMINYLSNRVPNRPVRDKTILGRLLAIVDQVMAAFEKLITRATKTREGVNGFQEMLAVIEHLVAIQSKHQSQYAKLVNKTYNLLDDTDQKIRQFSAKQALSLIKTGKTNKLDNIKNAIVTVPTVFLSENVVALRARQYVYETMNKTMRSLASEIGGGVLSEDLIEQLLHAKVNISKARQEAERFTIKWFNESWKTVDGTKQGDLPAETREALTNVVLRTDMSSLKLAGYSNKAIANLIGHSTNNRAERKRLLGLLRLKASDPAAQYLDELGNFIITGDTQLHNPHMNVHTIAQQFMPRAKAADIANMNAYATLVAMENVDFREGKTVKDLAQAELAVKGTANGFADLLDSHILFKEKSAENLFKNNPTQVVKGFIIERVDNLTTTRTGKASEAAQMKKAGFAEAFPMGTVPGVLQTHDTLFIGRNIPEVAHASGIMSTTNQRSMGTTLTEIYSADPQYQMANGNPNLKAINAQVRKVIKEEGARSKNLAKNKSLKLRPLRNDQGKIVDYRVMMNHSNKKTLLKPDLEIQNVFAHMHSVYVDRKNTIISDKETVDILVHEQAELLPSNRDIFVDFLDPSGEYIEHYRKLPRQVREYINSFAINGKFMVRRDIIDKVFGFKVWDLSQLKFLQSDRLASVKRYAGLLHYLIRQTVGYGKDRIVIAMPAVVFNNMISNIFQLIMRKIPVSFVFNKLLEGFVEYERYKKDTDKLRVLRHKDLRQKLPANHPTSVRRAKEILSLKTRIENNRIHQMSAAGLNSLIVEDLNEASVDGYFNRLRKTLKVDTKLPTAVSKVAAEMFMTKSSKPYQLSRHIVQLTDFLGRYVMIEHAVHVKGQDFKTAMHDAINAFVLFDETLTPAAEALDAIGGTSFVSYFLRNQRASRKLAVASPTAVGLSAVTQYATGIPTLGNLNSSFVTGDITPNLLQLDDLFDEANNVTGVDLLRDIYNVIFD